MRPATLQFETRLQKCIRIGITIFKIFIWGGISSDIRLEIMFYGDTLANENFEYGYPLIKTFFLSGHFT